jgi:hypothetical protein
MRWNRSLLLFAGLLAALALVSLVGIFVDHRVLVGVPIWLKPFKFGLSFSLYCLTLAWMLSVLRNRSRVAEGTAVVVAAMAAVENLIVVVQVIRGTTSHFNTTTEFNGQLWKLMGYAIGMLFVGHLVIAVVAIRQSLDRVAGRAIRLGLALSALGMLAAIPMVVWPTGLDGVSGAHSVGLPDGGPGLPLVGWSTVGGDLRIGHFVGLHGLQAMPLLALALRRLERAAQARLLAVAGAAYAALTASLTWQAMRGQSLVHPDALTLTVWAALLGVTMAAAAAVLAQHRVPALP